MTTLTHSYNNIHTHSNSSRPNHQRANNNDNDNMSEKRRRSSLLQDLVKKRAEDEEKVRDISSEDHHTGFLSVCVQATIIQNTPAAVCAFRLVCARVYSKQQAVTRLQHAWN